MKYNSILLFGPPGSGKGTQGKIIGARPGYLHFACGDVFRSLDPNSDMGQLFARYSRGGGLVPDEFTVRLWQERIDALASEGRFDPAGTSVILDGIPRTVEQARLMADRIEVSAVIYLYCNDISAIIERMKRRAQTEKRADDTNEEVIRHRLDVYEEQTRPVLEIYPPRLISRINATQELEVVTAGILQALGQPKT